MNSVVTTLMVETHFHGSFAKILWTISHKVLRTTTSKTIMIFPLIQLYVLAKWMIYPTN